MATLSPQREAWPLLKGLELLNRGKVRDLYALPDGYLLMVATDGISIFDFVLNALVPMKGIILTAMSVFWFKMLEKAGFKTHLEAYGSGIDAYLPEKLRKNTDLQSRALVVRELDMIDDVEFVYRWCLTGSALGKDEICGVPIPADLQDGDLFPGCPVFTPTSKASEGHDEPIASEGTRVKYPQQAETGLRAFLLVQRYAHERGLFFLDTKLELAKDGTIGDELFTPDSSRVVDKYEWERSRRPAEGRKCPVTYDKQYVRSEGMKLGVNKMKPEKPEDVAAVHAIKWPQEVIDKTAQIYRFIFWRLTGKRIEDYLRDELGVNLPEEPKQKLVAVICGSESDMPSVEKAVNGCPLPVSVHVLSCHRNSEELRDFAMKGFDGAEVVIGVGSKALALPGIVAAHLRAFGHEDIPVIGVALGEPGSDELMAARLSIEELPDNPVVIDEATGSAYWGENGLTQALMRVEFGEFPPTRPRENKSAKLYVHNNYNR